MWLLKLLQEVTDVTPTHISLTKASHVITPTFKGGEEAHPTMYLGGGENWDICEQHYFQPQ